MTEQAPASVAGFTIGPLGDVLRHARKTRELWFGSYLFSWYMETLVGRVAGPEVRFLAPHVPEGGPAPAFSTTGKYPDRFVAESDLSADELFERVQRANDETMETFAGILREIAAREISDFGGIEIDASPEAVSRILQGYLQTRFFALPGADVDMEKPVEKADRWLTTLEESLRFDTGRGRHTCNRCKILPGAVRIREISGEGENRRERRIPMCPICLAKFRANRIGPLLARMPPERVETDRRGRGRMRYPTLQEIAARQIYEEHGEIIAANRTDSDEDDADRSFSEIEKIIGRKIPAAFRYVAVVRADGDRLGKLAGALRNPAGLSERLFRFAEAAEKTVEAYGGISIYIGGDDLLAFLPVFYRERTVVDFAEAISRRYAEIVGEGLPEDAAPSTLSLGVNVVYYKFPLSTALQDTEDLLFGTAKIRRNTAAIQLTRHAGSRLGLSLRRGRPEFSLFGDLLRGVLSAAVRSAENAEAEKPGPAADPVPDQGEATDAKGSEDDGTPPRPIRIPGGLSYNLRRYHAVLAALPDAGRLEAFFDNNFDEGEHRLRFETGLDKVREIFAHYLFERESPTAIPDDPSMPEDPIRKRYHAAGEVFSILKFIKFLTGEEEDR
jgi:CRISPR-associated protein Cmr2